MQKSQFCEKCTYDVWKSDRRYVYEKVIFKDTNMDLEFTYYITADMLYTYIKK